MRTFERVIAFLEIAPKRDESRLIGVRGGQRFEAIVGETRGEDLNGQMLLALAVHKNGEPISFLDAIVRNGNAADGSAVSM